MPNWQDRVAAKRAQAANAIPAAWRLPSDVLARWAGGAPVMDFFDKETGILSAEEREMTECTAGEAIQVSWPGTAVLLCSANSGFNNSCMDS